jgi:hypothetical protein
MEVKRRLYIKRAGASGRRRPRTPRGMCGSGRQPLYTGKRCRYTNSMTTSIRIACAHHPRPKLSVSLHQTSIKSSVSTTPAAATPPPTPTVRRMHYKLTLAEPSHSTLKTYPSHACPTNCSDSRQQRRSRVPAVQQNGQRGDVVDDDCPRDSRRTTR